MWNRLPDGRGCEPVSQTDGDGGSGHMLENQVEGRDSTPSLEAGRASRSGLLEVRTSTGETIVLWVLFDRQSKSERPKRERADNRAQEGSGGPTNEHGTLEARRLLTGWKAARRIGES